MTLRGLMFMLTATVLSAGSAAAVPPAEKCEAGKLKQAGKYGFCRLKAEAKAVKSGDPPEHSKCDATFGLKWSTLEDKADGMCPTNGDQVPIGLFISDHTDNVAAALNGGGLPGRGQRVRTGQTTCNDTPGAAIACAGTGQDGELQTGLSVSFTDNGDGTITDHRTGLMWEKLSDDGTIHDKDDAYTWGDAFAIKIAMLNGMLFGGYDDWRLPNINELQSLVSYSESPTVHAPFNSGCIPGCAVSTCSCTQGLPVHTYWTSTSLQPIFMLTPFAYHVSFLDGRALASAKTTSLRVRAVRGGT